jgi:hypothetical protein
MQWHDKPDDYKIYKLHDIIVEQTNNCILQFLYMQVFAYGEKRYKEMVSDFGSDPGNLHGSGAVSFVIYTAPHHFIGPHEYGYTVAASKICIASDDPVLSRSIQAGEWYEGINLKGNSIFAPFFTHKVNIDQAFHEITVTEANLTSLSTVVERKRRVNWRNVYNSGIYSRFYHGKGVSAHFSNHCPYDISAVYKDSSVIGGDGLLSTIATPTVSLFQEVIQLDLVKLMFPEEVKQLSTFSNALHFPTLVSNVIEMPPNASISVVSHIISADGSTDPSDLRMNKQAFSAIKTQMFCGEFYGALRISSTDDDSESLFVLNGLAFEVLHEQVIVTRDIRQSPPSEVLTKHITDLQFSLTAAESRVDFLKARKDEKSVVLMRRYLLWLSNIAGACTPLSSSVSSLRLRASYLAKQSTGSRAEVPYLSYEAYKDTVQSVSSVITTVNTEILSYQNQIRERKRDERLMKSLNEINQNIVTTGNLLADYISAQAKYQGSLRDMFKSFADEAKKKAGKLFSDIKQYNDRVNEQVQAVMKATGDFKKAFEEWQREETIKACVGIVLSIFTAAASVAVPEAASQTLTNFAKMVNKIQKLLKIFNTIFETFKSIDDLPSNPDHLTKALDDLKPGDLQYPSSIEEWMEMKANLDAILQKVPDAVTVKFDLSAAFKILILRGKTLMDAQNQLQKILCDLSAAKQQSSVHKEQTDRLNELKTKLSVQPSELKRQDIDLIQMTGQLVFFERQMLSILSSTLLIQDHALQCEYLQSPTLMTSFTFLNLKVAILNQNTKITTGLAAFNPQPRLQNPVVYKIEGIHPELLTSEGGYAFSISLHAKEFMPFHYVRIEDLDVKIEGIDSTDTGQYYLELVYAGDPFYDKDISNAKLEFETVPRYYNYLNSISGNGSSSSMTKQSSFSDKISKVTPFSYWRLSLPPNAATNQGITFDTILTISLTFKLFAQLKEDGVRFSKRAVISLDEGEIEEGSVTNAKVLSAMQGKSVTGRWDAVLSMTLKEVNSHLIDQYHDHTNIPKFLRNTTVIHYDDPPDTIWKERTLYLTFNAPKIDFYGNNSNFASIVLPITGGYFQEIDHYPGGSEKKPKVVFNKKDGDTVTGSVELSSLVGQVDEKMKVVLNISKGKYVTSLSSTLKDAMVKLMIQRYFEGLSDGYEFYILGELSTKNLTSLPSLTPTSFHLKIIKPSLSNRSLLQVFIATKGTVPSYNVLSIDEPVPTDYECSLIIKSEIYFKHILEPLRTKNATENKVTINFDLDTVDPESDTRCWSAVCDKGSLTSTDVYTIGMVCEVPGVGIMPFTFNITGQEVSHSLGKILTLTCKDSKTVINFKYDTDKIPWDSSGICFQFTIEVDAAIDFNFDSDKMVKIELNATNINVDNSFYGDCIRRDHLKFYQTLKSAITPTLTKVFDINLPSISIFALQNILFPSGSTIDMKEVHTPGDLVIFGNFTKPSRGLNYS